MAGFPLNSFRYHPKLVPHVEEKMLDSPHRGSPNTLTIEIGHKSTPIKRKLPGPKEAPQLFFPKALASKATNRGCFPKLGTPGRWCPCGVLWAQPCESGSHRVTCCPTPLYCDECWPLNSHCFIPNLPKANLLTLQFGPFVVKVPKGAHPVFRGPSWGK